MGNAAQVEEILAASRQLLEVRRKMSSEVIKHAKREDRRAM